MIRLLPLALACVGPAKDGPDSGAPAEETASPDDTAPEDTGPDDPVDVDSDGSLSDVDCDDLDPRRYPGNDETWDEIDNDCDDRVDADGDYSGTWTLAAEGIYKTTRYGFTLTCDAAMRRAEGALDLTAICLPDDPDEWSDLLLGESITVTIYPGDEDVEEAEWADWVVFTSSDGWDTEGDGVITWSDMDSASISLALDAVYLDIYGGGPLVRE